MGSIPRLTSAQWRKSSYSTDTGGSCVECAPLGPLSWRKSSHSSDQGGDCVEIAATPASSPTPTLLIRDSKNPAGPHLTLGPAAFTTFLDWASTVAG
ncbi:DUF397 domain-containing protein [Streptomyces neyagawaensis]|uniref:DUF397 domain-containing protein n=1 Tax=Streptomyces neyagawaensis TaxID=42238 RepID=UPI00201CB176|nr:DUF397 domain-containing protein [Streptomyces neyagawaensis]MCL6732734.1 DUF397 domain-containing protein [Streptomyces neyagawaensis]MDE1681496.1 DUF397 domain-containing protein [Streptomyces neyagawaensis]